LTKTEIGWSRLKSTAPVVVDTSTVTSESTGEAFVPSFLGNSVLAELVPGHEVIPQVARRVRILPFVTCAHAKVLNDVTRSMGTHLYLTQQILGKLNYS